MVERNTRFFSFGSFRQVFSFLAVFILFASLSSCIEIHAFFKLNQDGSGVGRITYVVAEGIYSAPDDSKIAINEDKIAEVVARKEGVKVIKTGSSYEDGNRIRVWVEFEFKDISTLSDSFSKYIIEDLGNGKKELRIKVRFSGYLHKREMLKDMFKGLNSSIEIVVPGKVIGTNGKVLSSDRVRWDIDAREIVGIDTEKIFIVQYEVGKDGIFRKIINKIKNIF